MKRARKGSGSFTDLGKKGWRYQFSLGVVSGKRIRRSVTGRTQEQCRKEAAKVVAQWAKDQPGTADEPLASYLARWLDEQAKRLRPNTLDAYRTAVEVHTIPVIGAVRLRDLTYRHVEQVMRAVEAKGRSGATANRTRAALRTALTQAIRDGLLVLNPASLAHPAKERPPKVEPLTPGQAKRLLEATRGSRWWPVYVIAISLGLRQGELLALRWEDVEDDRLHVRHTLRWSQGRVFLDPPKTADSEATLPLTDLVKDALRVQRLVAESDRLMAGKAWTKGYDPLGLIFRTHVGRPLEGKRVAQQFHDDLEASGLPRVRFHDLRHTCATFLLSEHVDLKVVSEVLRHSSIAVTASTYAHVTDATLKGALDSLGWLGDE